MITISKIALVGASFVSAEVGPRPPPGFTKEVIDDMQKFFHPES